MEEYQIRLSENLTIENLFDKLSLRCWTMIQKELKPQQLTIQTYRRLSERLRRNLEIHVESYDICGNSCDCNETTISKPLSPEWELDTIETSDKIFQLFVPHSFDGFIEEVADDLTESLKNAISFGKSEKVHTIVSTVLKCVLGDHIYWNSLCRASKRSACQPSCCSLML
ncbi:MAG TPA: hypothetical protein VLH08_23030 [Acidobacteriota bacterium]|nr:hypothetical protein [Acidobacteriota bacterium]